MAPLPPVSRKPRVDPSAWRGLPSQWPTQISVAPPTPGPAPTPTPTATPSPTRIPVPPKSAQSGFDTCTAPSISTMKAWRAAYSVVGIYIGGVNAACDYGNLSAGWVRQARALGWSMLPTYVGPQAPCYGYGVSISASQARAQGRQAADDAVSDARLLGLPKGSPVYYDMEAYNEDNASCVSAVVNFLGAWTSELDARGYVSAVYSSQDSGITDLNTAAKAKVRGFTAPRAVWIALWDNRKTLVDGNLTWPVTDRAKQYAGPHEQKIGGFTLNIDSDYVAGPTAG